ncbi:hypothetical protein C0J52_03080 [Blattella germanica]|nr:hypothetical protein C0J52_03080 [Blattella germanica]
MFVDHIASKVGISMGSVHTIQHEDKKIRKASSRWVPRKLTDDPRTHIGHIQDITNTCLTQLTMNFIRFHTTKMEKTIDYYIR